MGNTFVLRPEQWSGGENITSDEWVMTQQQADRLRGMPSNRQINLVGEKLQSAELFRQSNELIIVHGEDHYKLRLTANNKLILTK